MFFNVSRLDGHHEVFYYPQKGAPVVPLDSLSAAVKSTVRRRKVQNGRVIERRSLQIQLTSC